jgi:predicted lipid carrier protein YhbT
MSFVGTLFLPVMRPARRFAAHLPHPGSRLLVTVLNATLRRDLPDDVLENLRGKHVAIAVSDWGLRFQFGAANGRFVTVTPGKPDLTITATAHDFGALACGEEDADTLYFDRRVVVEGSTEVALLIKNSLDAVPATRMRSMVAKLHRAMVRLRSLRGRSHSAGAAPPP